MIESQKSNFERSVLVGVTNDSQNEEKLNEFLEELEFLSVTAGGKVIRKFTQKINTPNPKTFIGKGKIEEIQKYIKKNDVSIVVFDDELSPTQQANIEKILKCKILDRTALILDIFAQRAKTSYAKTQVELAQYEYLLPRLKGLWTHLERQKGGIGMRAGATGPSGVHKPHRTRDTHMRCASRYSGQSESRGLAGGGASRLSSRGAPSRYE